MECLSGWGIDDFVATEINLLSSNFLSNAENPPRHKLTRWISPKRTGPECPPRSPEDLPKEST
jgi:hypothetical protein